MTNLENMTDPIEILLLAWEMEEGTRVFYQAMARREKDRRLKDMFAHLAEVEATHQEILNRLYERLPGFPESGEPDLRVLFAANEGKANVVEGQSKLREALAWAAKRTAVEVLSYSMSLETAQFDLYVKLKQQFASGVMHSIFSQLAQQEKSHLQKLSELLDELLEV